MEQNREGEVNTKRGHSGNEGEAGQHDARAVANVMIEKGVESGHPLTPLQIIKLTYLCQAWMLGMFGKSIFEQRVEAWKYGPVVADVYHGVKRYVDQPVHEVMRARPAKFSNEETDVLGEVYRVYGSRSGGALSGRTHKEGTPWWQVRQENPDAKDAEIDTTRIRRYYEDILRDPGAESVTGL